MSYCNAFINDINSHLKLNVTPIIISHTKTCKIMVKLNNLEVASKTKKKSTKR